MIFGTSEINLLLALGLCALQPFVSPLRKSQLPLTLIGSYFCYEKFRQFLDCSIKQENNNKNSLIKKKNLVQNIVQNIKLLQLNCPPVHFQGSV